MISKDSSVADSNEVPSCDFTTQKTPSETGYPHTNSKSNRKRKCANPNCASKAENCKLERVSFNNGFNYYCDRCAESIKKKWVCHFCNFICVEGDNAHYNTDWIACDFNKCPRWTHIECERKYGLPNILDMVADESLKYYCPICRAQKNLKKVKESRPDTRRGDKFSGFDDFRKTMISKRRCPVINYTYLHSENYQSIEKLVSAYGNGIHSLALKDNELMNDLKVFNSCLGKNAFDVPNATEKSTSSKPENLEKRSLKKFTKGSARN